jgi:hypothetical protein
MRNTGIAQHVHALILSRENRNPLHPFSEGQVPVCGPLCSLLICTFAGAENRRVKIEEILSYIDERLAELESERDEVCGSSSSYPWTIAVCLISCGVGRAFVTDL